MNYIIKPLEGFAEWYSIQQPCHQRGVLEGILRGGVLVEGSRVRFELCNTILESHIYENTLKYGTYVLIPTAQTLPQWKWWEPLPPYKKEVEASTKHNHYFKDCPYGKVDVYRILEIFDVTDPCIQHCVKKLLCAGGRGYKDINLDINNVIDTLQRWKDMREEEKNLEN